MVLSTSRRLTVRGRPPRLAPGSRGSTTAHCSSVRSVGYPRLFVSLMNDITWCYKCANPPLALVYGNITSRTDSHPVIWRGGAFRPSAGIVGAAPRLAGAAPGVCAEGDTGG